MDTSEAGAHKAREQKAHGATRRGNGTRGISSGRKLYRVRGVLEDSAPMEIDS